MLDALSHETLGIRHYARVREEAGLPATREVGPDAWDRKGPRRILIGLALLPGCVAFAAADYLLSRSWLWAFLVVPTVVGSIGFLVWFDRRDRS